MEAVQLECLAVGFGQALHGGADLLLQLLDRIEVGRFELVVEPFAQVAQHPPFDRLVVELLEAAVAHGAEQVGRQRIGDAQGFAVLPEPQHHVLHDVLAGFP